ncbi:MAG TPA: glycosyltransferase [Gammaproteobacteria bacterium]|nr:glycosyltransferase [Gammaproteobacteria bacterium]
MSEAWAFPRARILVFARAPRLGTVKTRLATEIGEAAALAVYEQLLEHSLRVAAADRLAPVELHVAGDTGNPVLQRLAARYACRLVPQVAGDLGRRMQAALETALGRAEVAVLVGSDCPVLAAAHLRRVLERLAAGSTPVFIPAEDGGYVLIGTRDAPPWLFRDIDWGSEHVMSQTRQRLAQHACRAIELEPLWDLDRPQDLLRWQRQGGFTPPGG